MELVFNKDEFGRMVSFDGRVLEIFPEGKESYRYHIRQITSIQLGPPDKHGKQDLTFKVRWGEYDLQVAPDQVGAAQELVAAVQQAILTPR